MTKKEKIKIGKYKHFKGMVVEVIGTALHSETLEEMVIYNHPDPVKGQGANTTWVRPLEMFLGYKEKDGNKVKRFTFISKN